MPRWRIILTGEQEALLMRSVQGTPVDQEPADLVHWARRHSLAYRHEGVLRITNGGRRALGTLSPMNVLQRIRTAPTTVPVLRHVSIFEGLGT